MNAPQIRPEINLSWARRDFKKNKFENFELPIHKPLYSSNTTCHPFSANKLRADGYPREHEAAVHESRVDEVVSETSQALILMLYRNRLIEFKPTHNLLKEKSLSIRQALPRARQVWAILTIVNLGKLKTTIKTTWNVVGLLAVSGIPSFYLNNLANLYPQLKLPTRIPQSRLVSHQAKALN